MNSTPSNSHEQTPTPLLQEGMTIGTQESQPETTYYDLLGVPVDATIDDIKNAYRYLMIRYLYHCDKNWRHDPNAEGERIKSISIAYQTLSDPELRHKYNQFGPEESAPEGGFVDPEEVFRLIFGGERFLPLIGRLCTLWFPPQMKTAVRRAYATEGGNVAAPLQRDVRESGSGLKLFAAWNASMEKLAENLCDKLRIFTENATSPTDPEVTESWRRTCSLEAEELKGEFYGVELLNAIGLFYTTKAKHFFAYNRSFLGVGAWLYYVQSKFYVALDMMSARRLVDQRNDIFDQILQGEESGTLSAEEKKCLEERALETGLQGLFMGTKMEMDCVLRYTCNLVLYDPTISHTTAVLRAAALQTLGDAYMAVRNEREAGDARR